MLFILKIVQLISFILLIISILIQNRGAGLSATFGGTDTFFAVKRGAERVVAIATIAFAVIFITSSILVGIM